MKAVKLQLGKVFGYIFKNVWTGILFAAPFVITAVAVNMLAILILNELDRFVPGVTHEEIVKNPLWRLLAFGIALLITFILGVISQKTFMGKTLNQWSDTTIKKIPVIGSLYGFANDLIQQIEKGATTSGKPIIMPCLNDNFPQVGHIMNSEKIMLYNKKLGKEVPHCPVLFKSAYGFFTGTVFFVPQEMIVEHEKYSVCDICAEDAIKFNLLGGSFIPKSFKREPEPASKLN
jgi:uncharacterized membrane protein